MADSGKVLIHGKEYETVASRIKRFRDTYKDYAVVTEIVARDEEVVVMKATISNEQGRVLATGHSEEVRASSQINKTSALENAETSAIGRALAAFGLGGTEFASADEVANAISQQRAGVHKPTDGAMLALNEDERTVVRDTAVEVIAALAAGKDHDAFGLCESITDNDSKVALWSLLDSKQRRRIKEAAKA